MPKATLPTSPKGWFVALTASLVGFLAGFITISIMQKWM